MDHYVCTGECNGVSEIPLSCQLSSCSEHNHSLVFCDCTDGKHEGLERPALIVLAGLPGTGKSTIGKLIAKNLGYVYMDQNDIKREHGMKRMPKKFDAVLRDIDRRVANTLFHGKGIVLDSVHRYMFRRQQIYGVASGAGTQVLLIEFKCSSEESKRRMGQRPNSDGLVSDPNNPIIYDKLAQLWEEVLENDFKYPGSDHVSYIVYDSEKIAVEKKIVQKEVQRVVEKIEPLLVSFSA